MKRKTVNRFDVPDQIGFTNCIRLNKKTFGQESSGQSSRFGINSRYPRVRCLAHIQGNVPEALNRYRCPLGIQQYKSLPRKWRHNLAVRRVEVCYFGSFRAHEATDDDCQGAVARTPCPWSALMCIYGIDEGFPRERIVEAANGKFIEKKGRWRLAIDPAVVEGVQGKYRYRLQCISTPGKNAGSGSAAVWQAQRLLREGKRWMQLLQGTRISPA